MLRQPVLIILLGSFLFCHSCNPSPDGRVLVRGELKKWHKVTLEVRGPEVSEWDRENPFLDYRLDVIFSKGDRMYRVPGYFAADGKAAETSAEKGNVWKVHFRPDEEGTWEYQVSFRKGRNISVTETPGGAVSPDGATGTLEIGPSDKSWPDLRNRGRIVNGGKGYYRFQESGDIWIKSGTDSPENFLAYEGFDQTYRFSLNPGAREGEANPESSLHRYNPHMKDWKEGDPVWQGGKGKGIIGAVNYLSAAGVNSIYMLTMNIMGDGKDVWPYSDYNERCRFDCSKLEQWERVFDHMEHLGIMAHFVLQETENECLLDMGNTGIQRRVYLRELVARFGHHLALCWNLGEENGPTDWSPIGQTESQKKEMALYLDRINPYPGIIVLHTHSNDEYQDLYLNPLLGFGPLDGPSMQVGNPSRVHERIGKWVESSRSSGKPWIVCLDEIGPAGKGVLPDALDMEHDTLRYQCLWGSLMAGAAGVEWYFGYRFPNNDLNCEDFRSREEWYRQSAVAAGFLEGYPLEKMSSRDDLVDGKGAWCLAAPGGPCLLYFPSGINTGKGKQDRFPFFNMDLFPELGVKWFDPEKGGSLQEGSISGLKRPGMQSLGVPPGDPEKDWVAVLY